MSESSAPKIEKWPFIVGDVALLIMAWLVYYHSDPEASLGGLEAFWCFACVATGAWVMVLPFLREFQAEADLTEAKELAASVEKISSVDGIARQIESATEQWLHVEDRANEINAAYREIAGKINAEAREFTEFLQKANDTEKNHLRLEVDKLGRAQGDWVKVVTGMLDHVFALNRPAGSPGRKNWCGSWTTFKPPVGTWPAGWAWSPTSRSRRRGSMPRNISSATPRPSRRPGQRSSASPRRGCPTRVRCCERRSW